MEKLIPWGILGVLAIVSCVIGAIAGCKADLGVDKPSDKPMPWEELLFEQLDAELRRLTDLSDPARWIIITRFVDSFDFDSEEAKKPIGELAQEIIKAYDLNGEKNNDF